MKKIIFLFIVFGVAPLAIGASTDKQRAKQSKSSIKEEIGEKIKGTLSECVELSRQMAQLQMKLSDMEDRLLAKGEDLLDGGSSFKKSHAELSRSLTLMTEAHQTMESLVAKLNSDSCLGITCSTESA